MIALLAGACTTALPILGAIAVWQIKRSNGQLHGLPLAAVEAIVVPLFFLTALVGHGVFWPMVGLLMLIAPQRYSCIDDVVRNEAVVVPMVIFAVCAALVFAFFTGRAAFRKIVGRPEVLPKPKAKPRRKRMYWLISQFPELDHLDPVEKADVLGAIPSWTYRVIFVRAFAGAVVVAGITAFIVVNMASTVIAESRMDGEKLGYTTILLLGPVVWICFYLVQLSRLRGVIRGEIAKAFRGQKPPFCFNCGYDLRGTTGGACPECGTAISTGGARASRPHSAPDAARDRIVGRVMAPQAESMATDSPSRVRSTAAALARFMKGRGGMVTGAVLQVIYVLCVLMFFSFHASRTQAGASLRTGLPGPWLMMERNSSGFHSGCEFFASSVAVALFGLAALAAWRRIERFRKGKTHSIAWHYAIWGLMFAIVLGVEFYLCR